MGEELDRPRRGRYSEEEMRRGLTEVALCAGNGREASRRLAEHGHPIPRATLQNWIHRHAERYEEIKNEVVPIIHERLVQELEAPAVKEAKLELKFLERTERELPKNPARPPGGLRNVSTAGAINIDKALLLRGKPTDIRQKNTANLNIGEMFATLQRLAAGAVTVEGTAEEITTGQVAGQSQVPPSEQAPRSRKLAL